MLVYGQTRDDFRAQLIETITSYSVIRKETKLSSGGTSPIYFNLKTTMLDPMGAAALSRMMLSDILINPVDIVAGLELGAVPIIGALMREAALASPDLGLSLQGMIMRKSTKEHGTSVAIEGIRPGQNIAGLDVAVVEDVTTTGTSAMRVVDAFRAAGANVISVHTIVDRQEGADEVFAASGVAFTPLLTRSEIEASMSEAA